MYFEVNLNIVNKLWIYNFYKKCILINSIEILFIEKNRVEKILLLAINNYLKFEK